MMKSETSFVCYVKGHFCIFGIGLELAFNRGFARQPCCMAGTMKIFCIRKNVFFPQKKNLLFPPCNMAAVPNL